MFLFSTHQRLIVFLISSHSRIDLYENGLTPNVEFEFCNLPLLLCIIVMKIKLVFFSFHVKATKLVFFKDENVFYLHEFTNEQ